MNRARAIRNLVLAEVAQATPAELAAKPVQRWSALEVLIHIGNWEEEAVNWLPYLLKGEQPPQREQKPIDELNAEMIGRYAHLDVKGALEYLAGLHTQYEELASAVTDVHLQNLQILGILLMVPDHEVGHLHQVREALALARGEKAEAAIHHLRYHRQRVLARLNLELRPVESVNWRPEAGKWSIKEMLVHLAVWDRFAVGVFAAIAEGRPIPAMPFPEGGLDEWNKAQVSAAAWMTLADVLGDLGAAREAMELQIRRLTPEQAESAVAQEWFSYGEHDKEHMMKIMDRIGGWRKAQAK